MVGIGETPPNRIGAADEAGKSPVDATDRSNRRTDPPDRAYAVEKAGGVRDGAEMPMVVPPGKAPPRNAWTEAHQRCVEKGVASTWAKVFEKSTNTLEEAFHALGHCLMLQSGHQYSHPDPCSSRSLLAQLLSIWASVSNSSGHAVQ